MLQNILVFYIHTSLYNNSNNHMATNDSKQAIGQAESIIA